MSTNYLNQKTDAAVAGDGSEQKTTIDRSAVTDIIMAVLITVLLTVIIITIVQSPYIHSFCYPTLYSVLGFTFIIAKTALVFRNGKDIHRWYIIGITIAMLVGAIFVSNSDVETAKWGVYLMIATHIMDAVYLGLSKYSWKKDICPIALWGGIASNILIVILLIYSLMKSG